MGSLSVTFAVSGCATDVDVVVVVDGRAPLELLDVRSRDPYSGPVALLDRRATVLAFLPRLLEEEVG